jgi:hypothetical protein
LMYAHAFIEDYKLFVLMKDCRKEI